MKKFIFVSKSRGIISSILALVLIFYAFNFIPRNINIIATRSLGRQIFDYLLNFLIFFIVIYSVSSLFSFIYKKLFKK
jgi:hypothetical protein